MTTYAKALRDPAARRITTVEASPLNMSTREVETLRLANAAFRTSPSDADPNRLLRDRLSPVPKVEHRLWTSRRIGGRSEVTRTDVDFRNLDGALAQYDSRRYAWDGRRIVVRDGAEGVPYEDFATLFTGTAKDARSG